MSSVKRKNNSDEATRKNSHKRLKSDNKDKSSTASTTTNHESSNKPAKVSAASLLVKEQPAFPRGGASLLTPLERKQIHAKASRDAAVEQKQSSDLFGSKQQVSDKSDEDDSDKDLEGVQEQSKKKRTSKKSRSKTQEVSKEDTVPIEGLSYKRLAPGTLVLGCITAVGSQDLTMSLPNNLTGYVSLTEISAPFSEKLQAVLKSEETNKNEDEDDEDDEQEIALAAHFREGQYVRCAVVSLGDEGSGKTQSRKRVDLTLDPRKVNAGINKSSLAVGCMVQAAVVSVEDHGVVMDLGLVGREKIRGFIPSKGLEASLPLKSIRIGTVLLCSVTSLTSDGKIVKLSSDFAKGVLLKNAPTVDAFLPGTYIEALVTEISPDGIAGKLMGLVDVTADIVHSGSFKDRESFMEKYKIGQKVKGRLICTFPLAEDKRLGFSLLENVADLTQAIIVDEGEGVSPKISSIVPSARVVRVSPGLGIYLAIPSGKYGFVHMSRLSDKKVDSVSETTGPYKVGSDHQARVLDYNPIDGLYVLSLQKKVIQQSFLRVDDVKVGEKVKATVEKLLIGPAGVQALILNLAEGVTGLVPAIHMSDITLLNPEKKFREGMSVNARVLSVNSAKKQLRLTLKKTLVNNDQRAWSSFEDISIGESTFGTLVKVDPYGALVQFYGAVRGFLPVSEISDAYIKDATEHFKVGQTLEVNAINVDATAGRLTLSCRRQSESENVSLSSLVPGTLVAGTVFEKSQSDLLLRLEGSNAIARLILDHVSDGSERKRKSALEKIRVGQKLDDVLILDVLRKGRVVNLTNKQTLVKAAQNGQFLKGFESLKEGTLLTGFISNITDDGVFVRFADGITGLITKKMVAVDAQEQPQFGLQPLQAVTAKVLSVDYKGATPRFWLTMREGVNNTPPVEPKQQEKPVVIPEIVNPVDERISKFTDLSMGKVTKARITSIKDTQINVELARDIQGRIDMSELFNQWEDIKDRKYPLKTYSPKQILTVRVLGTHDTRNHRFLPLTHRSGKNTVFELSAKPTTIAASDYKPLTLAEMQPGSEWLAYVNNIGEDHLMVNISPSVRGRIKAIDVSDDLSLIGDLEQNFPVGSALRVRVLAVDTEKTHLDLTAKSIEFAKPLGLEELSIGMIVPGRVTKITERHVVVQLSENLVGAVELIDMADDYTKSDTAQFQKNDVIRVCVVKIDIPNKKVSLSTRPSKVLSSSLKATDAEITSVKQLNINQIVRGFVSNVSDKGLFVTLGHDVTAFVRVTNLSDSYIKNWKDNFQRDQLVKGKVIAVDKDSGHVQLTLKESLMNADYKPPQTYTSLHVGDIVTGKVAKVETFGVFVLVDNSENVRGLCHRSEIAEQRVEDASKLFEEGDVVKAKVLKIDLPNRRINFGMKASYFASDDDIDEMDGESDSSASETKGGVGLEADIDMEDVESLGDKSEDDEDDSDEEADEAMGENGDDGQVDTSEILEKHTGLTVGGFDWHGISHTGASLKRDVEISDTEDKKSKPKKKRAEIQVDRTGDLDANGPQSTDDFERLLLGEPDSSVLWLQYMAFYLELGDTDQARSIGERALKTIGLGQDAEKLNIWIALLNLENAYGDDTTIESVFKRACEYNEPQEIYTRLCSIYIQSGKHQKADDLFQESLKKFTQDSKVYINYATFLFDTMSNAEKGRSILTRALQVLPPFTHFDLTSKFAQLEFKSSSGLAERGRTIFEGLINSFPKRIDLFNILLDMEMKHGDKEEGDSKEQIRALFERIFLGKLKPKQAKYFFKRWLAYEEEIGDERKIDEVKAKAATWVKQSGVSA